MNRKVTNIEDVLLEAMGKVRLPRPDGLGPLKAGRWAVAPEWASDPIPLNRRVVFETLKDLFVNGADIEITVAFRSATYGSRHEASRALEKRDRFDPQTVVKLLRSLRAQKKRSGGDSHDGGQEGTQSSAEDPSPGERRSWYFPVSEEMFVGLEDRFEEILKLLEETDGLESFSYSSIVQFVPEDRILGVVRNPEIWHRGKYKSEIRFLKKAEILSLFEKRKVPLLDKHEIVRRFFSFKNLKDLFEINPAMRLHFNSSQHELQTLKYFTKIGWVQKYLDYRFRPRTALDRFHHWFRRINYHQNYPLVIRPIRISSFCEYHQYSRRVHIHAVVKGINPLYADRIQVLLKREFGDAKVRGYAPGITDGDTDDHHFLLYLAKKTGGSQLAEHYPYKTFGVRENAEFNMKALEFDKKLLRPFILRKNCGQWIPWKSYESLLKETETYLPQSVDIQARLIDIGFQVQRAGTPEARVLLDMDLVNKRIELINAEERKSESGGSLRSNRSFSRIS